MFISRKKFLKSLYFIILLLMLIEYFSVELYCMNPNNKFMQHTYISKQDSPIKSILNKTGKSISKLKNPLTFAKVVSANFSEMPQPEITAEKVEKLPQTQEFAPSPVEKTIDSASGNVTILQSLSIKNQTSYNISKEKLIERGIPFTINSSNGPQVLIIHTHGTESYTPSEKYSFEYTENTRTTDPDYNVVRIGTEVADILKSHGINVIHDVTMYDYPDYNSSYDKAYYGIQAMLKKYPSIQIVLDIHRDAVNTETGETVKLVGDVKGEKAAQIMFVVGTDECGFSHPNWEYNLKFATLLQNKLYEISPSLVRPINLRTSRFNQHFTKGSLIVEVGTNGNTLDEALISAKYLAEAVKLTVDDMK